MLLNYLDPMRFIRWRWFGRSQWMKLMLKVCNKTAKLYGKKNLCNQGLMKTDYKRTEVGYCHLPHISHVE